MWIIDLWICDCVCESVTQRLKIIFACSSFYLLDFKGGPITKTGPKFKNHDSFPPRPIHANRIRTTAIKPDPYLSLSFHRVRVFQKHCSLLFVCICRLKSCSPPCLLSALEEIVFSRLLGKLTVSSLSQLPITNFFIFKFVYRRYWSRCVGLYWINLNSTRRVRRALLQFRDWTRWRRKRLHIFLFLAINFEMLDFSILIIIFFFFWRLLRKQLCGRKSIWMKNLMAMKKLSTKLKYLLIGI